MKVLQLITRRQYRGAEVFAATLSKYLIARGVDVVFVALYEPPVKPLVVDSATIIDLNGKKNFLSLSIIRKLTSLIQREDIDIIQANGSDTLKYAVVARYLSGKKAPVIYRNISMMSTWVGGNFFKRRFYSFLFSRVDFVTSVGQTSINDLTQLFDYPKSKTRVINRGIEFHTVQKEVARQVVLNILSLDAASRLIVHVGSFTAEKNHEFLVEVFTYIKKAHPHFKLVLVGDGERLERIKNFIRENRMEDTIFTVGFRKDVELFLSAAEIFVLCSKVEGIPGVILEAAAQKTPSISVDVGGVREVVRDGQTGVIQNGYNPKKFADEVVHLISDADKCKQMGENAYEFVRNNFDPGKNAELFIKLYNDLLSPTIR